MTPDDAERTLKIIERMKSIELCFGKAAYVRCGGIATAFFACLRLRIRSPARSGPLGERLPNTVPGDPQVGCQRRRSPAGQACKGEHGSVNLLQICIRLSFGCPPRVTPWLRFVPIRRTIPEAVEKSQNRKLISFPNTAPQYRGVIMENLQDQIHELLAERNQKIADDIRQNPSAPYPVIAKRHHCTTSVVQFVARLHGIRRPRGRKPTKGE